MQERDVKLTGAGGLGLDVIRADRHQPDVSTPTSWGRSGDLLTRINAMRMPDSYLLRRQTAISSDAKFREEISMQQNTAADANIAGWIAYAWIEAIEQDWIYIGTGENVARFRRQDLPPRWGDRYRSPMGNRILAQEIDSRGSPGNTALDAVERLDWPLADRR